MEVSTSRFLNGSHKSWIRLLGTVVALGFAASSCYVVLLYRHGIPYQDSWETVPLYGRYLDGSLDWEALWGLHNEHRLLFPRLLFLTDYLFARGTGYLLIVLTLLLQGLHVLLLRKSLGKHENLTENDRFFFSCAALVACFWLVQSGNFLWGFQVAWFLNGLFASLAAFLVCGLRAEAGNASNGKAVALAALCCVIAAYSVANGMFLCAVLLAVIWKAGLPRRFVVFWILFGLALGASYLVNFSSPGEGLSMGAAFRPSTWHYLLIYLGNPISRFSAAAGALAGGVGLALSGFFALRFFKEKRPSFFLGFGFAQIAYVVFTALVTAMGRAANFGVEQATSSRYYTTVVLFWFFLLVLAYGSGARRGRAVRWIRAGALLLFFFFIVPAQLMAVPQRQARYLKADEASLALVAGVGDTAALHYLYPAESIIRERNAFLRLHRLSIYREAWTHAPGRDLSAEYDVDAPSALQGHVEELRAAGSLHGAGYYVRGRVGPGERAEGAEIPGVILFANGGEIVGAAKTAKRPCRGCFSGYIGGLENDRFEMFALSKGSHRPSVRKIRPDPASAPQ